MLKDTLALGRCKGEFVAGVEFQRMVGGKLAQVPGHVLGFFDDR